MLHSFYCWGHMAVVLLSTLYFTLAGIENWRLLPPLWALVPLFTLFAFTKVPIYAIPGDDEETKLPKSIFRIKVFWILFFVMICAGASEQGVRSLPFLPYLFCPWRAAPSAAFPWD